MSEFNEKLKHLRTGRDMTRTDLAKILKVSDSSIAMYERNERMPSMQNIKEIAKYFNVDYNYLLDENYDVDYSLEDKPVNTVNEERSVYLVNIDSQDAAKFIYENPEYKELFETIKTVDKEEISFVRKMIERLK